MRVVFLVVLGVAACSDPVIHPSAPPPVIEPPVVVADPPRPSTPSPEPEPSAVVLDDRPCRVATAEERASIDTAEAFVRDNGYTSAPVPDGFELTAESLDGRHSLAEVLALRHDTLEPTAFGVFPHDGADMTVIFRSTTSLLIRIYAPAQVEAERALHGRAVEVAGGVVRRVVHASARLSHAERICAE